jgi:hypothetical protein
MCSCNCTGHSFFSSDSSSSTSSSPSSSSSSSSPDSHPKEALMISISSTAPPRKKESCCQLFKHLLFSNDKTTTTTTTTTTNKQPTRNQLCFLPSFLPQHINKSPQPKSNNWKYKASSKPELQEVSEQATAARARNPPPKQNKTQLQESSIHSFGLWCGRSW